MISMLVWEYNLPSWRMRNNGEVYWSGQQIFQLKWTSSKTGLLSKILPSLNEDLRNLTKFMTSRGRKQWRQYKKMEILLKWVKCRHSGWFSVKLEEISYLLLACYFSPFQLIFPLISVLSKIMKNIEIKGNIGTK